MEIKVKKEKIEEGKLTEILNRPKIIGYFDGVEYFAFSGICPHAKWPLELGTIDKCTLTCAGHSWGFDITDGKCKTNPGRGIKSYTVLDSGEDLIISEKDE